MPAIDIIKSKRRRRNVQPDEVFEAGPLLFARFGRLIVAKNVLTPEEHKKLQDKIPTIYADLERSIAAEIIALRKLLSPLDPRLFLQRAFGEFFLAHLGIEDEPSVTFDDHGVPARMIDYCHSLFAALNQHLPFDHLRMTSSSKLNSIFETYFDVLKNTLH